MLIKNDYLEKLRNLLYLYGLNSTEKEKFCLDSVDLK